MSHLYRGGYRYRSPYGGRRQGGSTKGTAVTLAVIGVLAYGAGSKLAGPHTAQAPAVHHRQATKTTQLTDVTGTGETAFMRAVLADLGAPGTAANRRSLTAWAGHEGSWGTVGQWNPLDTTLYEPGAAAFNTFSSGGAVLHVWNYPTAAEGAHATSQTLSGYSLITAALRSGNGLCGGRFAAEFARWSGSYKEVC